MAILNIETATTVCSVCLSDEGRSLFERTSFDGLSHASMLGVFVDDAVKAARELGLKMEAIAISSGPGSYTGLRIGVSMAKGICFGWNVPLISISTLELIAYKAIQLVSGDGKMMMQTAQPDAGGDAKMQQAAQPDAGRDALFCAMLDARRMEVFTALYDGSLQIVRDTEAVIVMADFHASCLEKRRIYFFGNGADKCKNLIQSPNAVFLDDIHPLASDMAILSEQAYRAKRFEDVAYFEPFYLKDFVATIPKNKILPKKDEIS